MDEQSDSIAENSRTTTPLDNSGCYHFQSQRPSQNAQLQRPPFPWARGRHGNNGPRAAFPVALGWNTDGVFVNKQWEAKTRQTQASGLWVAKATRHHPETAFVVLATTVSFTL